MSAVIKVDNQQKRYKIILPIFHVHKVSTKSENHIPITVLHRMYQLGSSTLIKK